MTENHMLMCLKERSFIYFFDGVYKTRTTFLIDTGRKLNVHKTFKRRPGRLM